MRGLHSNSVNRVGLVRALLSVYIVVPQTRVLVQFPHAPFGAPAKMAEHIFPLGPPQSRRPGDNRKSRAAKKTQDDKGERARVGPFVSWGVCYVGRQAGRQAGARRCLLRGGNEARARCTLIRPLNRRGKSAGTQSQLSAA